MANLSVRTNKHFIIALAVAGLYVWPVCVQSQDSVRDPSGTEDLSEIILSISPVQVVNQPLIGTAQLLLLDSAANPVTDYDLSAQPITVFSNAGTLTPSLLDNPASMVNGVIRLADLSVTFSGRSGLHTVTATNGTVTSSGVLVSFNGYDIHDVFDISGNDITTVYSGLPTTLNVTVANGGNSLAATDPYVKAFFTSDVSGSVKRYFPASSGGAEDTVRFLLENTLLQIGEDTLVLVLRSDYSIGGNVYPTADTVKTPVTVLDPAIFSIVPGSVTPEAIYAGPDFFLSFQVASDAFAGPIDSTFLAVDLVEFEGGPSVANLYTGSPDPSTVAGDILVYDSLSATVDSNLGLAVGSYLLSFDYRLISGANVFSLSDQFPATLTILDPPDFGYESDTFGPKKVAVEQENQFSFLVANWSTTDTVLLQAESAFFEISGEGFSARTSITFERLTLWQMFGGPGFSNVSRVSSEKIIIPTAMLGKQLTAKAEFRYRAVNAANWLTYSTVFESTPIDVIELPVARIIDLRLLTLNPGRVNTGQEFQIVCKVASRSLADITNLILKLTTNGASGFDSLRVATLIPAFDTVDVFFDIMAGNEFNASETFVAEIISDSISILPPIDNTAAVHIDLPASISLEYDLSPSAADGLIERGESFNLVVNWANTGTADISNVVFSFSTGGVDLGVEDPRRGTLRNDTTLVFFMTSPDIDTVLDITFSVLDSPTDQNTLLSVDVPNRVFEIEIEVASTEAKLQVSPIATAGLLLIPGTDVSLFGMVMSNTGSSSQTDMRLNKLNVRFTDTDGNPSSVRSAVEIGSSGFFEDGLRLGRAVAGGDLLTFYFDDFTIMAGQTRQIEFDVRLQDDLADRFGVELDAGSFNIAFTDERLSGIEVEVTTPSGGPFNLTSDFQSTGLSIEKSFVVETNPYNPELGPVRFAYVLDMPSDLEFRIFTLTGELVREVILREGDPGTDVSSEPHLLEWDGANDKGHPVLNGVYLVQLRELANGREATIKLAVVK